MAVERVCCPHGESKEGVKFGTTAHGKARLRCQTGPGCGRTFIRAYAYQVRTPQVKWQIVEMTLNGSGVRDIARVLQISPTTVIGELQKRRRSSLTSTTPLLKGAIPERSRERSAEWRLR